MIKHISINWSYEPWQLLPNFYENSNKYLNVEGSSYTGEAAKEFIVGTWWNHEIVKAKAQISGISGRIIDLQIF